ncbi:hypothetical protein R1flu_022088 [Riccia fluitans]|uniref:Uncharacterized protein n=1 Tax=Riccia fluitans TaxID=41844 RepID=A0ABD1ZSJ4_9MARC
MKKRSLALHYLAGVRRAMGTDSNGSSSDESIGGADRTRDGSLDVHGKPAVKSSSGGWKAAAFILVLQILTNTAFYSVANNLVIYLTTVMHEGNAAADKNGLVLLTTSASVPSLHPPQCPSKDVNCRKATIGQVAFFYVSLYVMDLGAGGVYGTMTAFGADQFDEEDDKEKKQKNSFFNWFYQSIFTGSLIGSTFSVYIQDNVSWGLGWGMSVIALVVGFAFLLLGAPLYRYHKPGSNPLTRIWQVLVAAFRKRNVALPANVGDLHETQLSGSDVQIRRTIQHSNNLRFLDKAASRTVTNVNLDEDVCGAETRWQLCSVTQVEEVKFVFNVLPIWLTSIMYSAVYSQIGTLFVEQGATMDLTMGSIHIPPASLSVFESSSVILWVLVYDCLLVPLLRRKTGNPRGISELQRIGIGLGLSVVAMVVAAVIERKRLAMANENLMDDLSEPIPMTVFWEIPQFFVMGASEVFTYIGLLEFFYNEAPYAIRSVGSSLSMLAVALGNFLSSVLVSVVNRIARKNGYAPGWIADNLNLGRIDLFYWLLAALSSLNLAAFVFCAMKYEYVKTQGLLVTPTESDDPDQDDVGMHLEVDEQRPELFTSPIAL